MRQLYYARQSLPKTQWSGARATLPFAPSSWALTPTLVLTGLRVVPGQAAKMGPLKYDYGILAVNAHTFLKPSDFTFLLSQLSADQRRFGRRHVLVTYLKPGDSGGFYLTLLPITPVTQAEPGWSQLTRASDMALFPMDSAGVKLQALGMALTAFGAAYQFYHASGMAEEERQRCARWRADGMPGPRPSTLADC